MPDAPKQQVKKKHHYTPQSYLSNFTDATGLLHVIWMKSGKRANVPTNAVGFERYLYRPDIDGGDPNVFEDAFAKLEGEAAPVIRDVIANRAMPTSGEQLNVLLNFIAFQAVRIPTMRKAISAPISHARRVILDLAVSSERMFRSQAKKAGMDPDAVSYEQAKAAVENSPEFPIITEEFLQHAMTMMDAMLPLLARRTWAVVYSDRPGEQFIVSDHPVTLMWSDGKARGFYGPGHAHLETDVTYPLGSSAALVGRFASPVKTGEADAWTVAAINSRTLKYAQTFIAGSTDQFGVIAAGKEILDAEKVIERITAEVSERHGKDE